MKFERLLVALLVVPVAFAGCSDDGESGGSEDTGPPIRPINDTSPGDVAANDVCTGSACPSDAGAPDLGNRGDVSPACRGVTCSGHGQCQGGTCICESGYRPDPQDRTKCIPVGGGGDTGTSDAPVPQVCQGVECNGPNGNSRGTCYENDAGQARCNCESGYKGQGVLCVKDNNSGKDSDGDGSPDSQDCAPNNPNRAPNLQEQCGDGIDNDCDQQVDENCGGGGGGLTCQQLVTCINLNCPNGNQSCVDAEKNKGSSQASSTYDSLLQCVNTNCSRTSPDDCPETQCSSSWNQCFPTTTGQQSLSCAEVFLCARHCPDNDQACIDSCVQRISNTGQPLLQSYNDCVNRNCPNARQTCIDQNCSSQLSQCFGC